ncbi:TetR family transcriptional regulator [Rhizobium sp. Root274]|nr:MULTISPECIES: TetR/AcrR family transcriptional regulator [unclassified Rhizobium]KQW29775.1 TetR family transcriptional regulator [Rhizobium sp. Root1240]KRD29970.1 TetR family transcriptional regulator [Rhizobium sp. Root274]
MSPDYLAEPTGGMGRFAAGEDPIKRNQIMDGAHRVFMKLGYDAASMNDVTREAGVSKGTIYVYFQSKEELFSALIQRAKGRFVESIRDLLAHHPDPEEGLRAFGLAFVRQIFESEMIPAMRILLGVVDRMPTLCQNFFASSPSNARTVLKHYLDGHVEAGYFEIEDTTLAAMQYIELATGAFMKGRLFNEITKQPSDEDVERVVNSGLAVFMAAYRRRPTAKSHSA